jgi:CRP-like cAMP-binding protein
MMIDDQPFLASEKLRAALQTVARTQYFSAGEKIFGRGEPLQGVFLVCSGKVRLSIGETRQTRNAGPRSTLGLPATIANTPYILSARAIDDAKLAFVSRERFMKAVEEQPDLRLEVVQMLGVELQHAQHTISSELAALGEVEARSVMSGLSRKKPRCRGPIRYRASVNPPGLARARALLAELKAQYSRLPDASRGRIREQLRSCAEARDCRNENNETVNFIVPSSNKQR